MANEAVRIPIEAVDNTKAAFNSVNANLNKTAKNAKVVTGSFGKFRGASQQLGFQIQDVAVQLQSGTAASTVFAQQGSQIASIFGPAGAVVGALIAVGAAVAGPLIQSLLGGTNALEEMGEAADNVATSLANMTATQLIQAQRQNAQAVVDAQNVITEATERLAQAEAKRAAAQSSVFSNLRSYQQSIEDQNQAIEEERAIIEEATIVIEKVEKANNKFAESQEKVANKTKETEDPLVAFNERMRDQLATMSMNNEQTATYNALKDGTITALEREAIQLGAAKDALTSYNEEKKRAEQLDKEILSGEQAASAMFGAMDIDRLKAIKKERKEKEDAKNAVLGNLDQQLEASAQNSKKMFAVNKAFRIAQATMQTYEAATKALAAFPPPFGQLAAVATVGFGLSQVAAIKSQSFEGGGFTGRGARAGGLDGKGGRMAMIHPNETVIDHTKGGASGITIINNVDARGSGADVDQRIKSAMAQTSQQTIMTIQDLMRRGRFA
jgi:hypothetical protein